MPSSHARSCHHHGVASPSRLAVIYCVRGSLANIRKTLECLQDQTAVDRIDLVLTADSPTLLDEAEVLVRSRGVLVNPRFVLHEATDLAVARVMAAKEASAEIMTIAEDHSFPEANCAEELLEVFDSCSRILAASPNMHNANPGSPVSQAQFLLTHGILKPVSGLRRTEDVDRLPWHNTTYRRAAFLAAVHDEGLMQAEGLLQEEIHRLFPEARFVYCHHTALWHVNMSRLFPAVEHAFHGGRIFGAERAGYYHWGWGFRLIRALAFPFVALRRMVRCMPILLDRHSMYRTLATSVTACLLATVHAMGEAVGVLGGKGRSVIKYSRYEWDRTGFLKADERHLLVSRSSVRGPSAGPGADHAHQSMA